MSAKDETIAFDCHPEPSPAPFAGMGARDLLLVLCLFFWLVLYSLEHKRFRGKAVRDLLLALHSGRGRPNMNRTYCVYILASRSRNLYTGVTGNLEPRMAEHRQGLIPGFTTRYRIFRLVHFELFNDIHAAIAREKEIKAWRREKKIWLVERNNPTWADIAEKIPHQYQGTALPKQIPHPRSPKPGDRVRDDKLGSAS